MVLELLEGEDLASRLERTGPLPPDVTTRWMIQIAGALEAAHARRIVHRDLKPQNLFLCARTDGEIVKVLDFGISKVLHNTKASTQEGMLLGTPHYMAPEHPLEPLFRGEWR